MLDWYPERTDPSEATTTAGTGVLRLAPAPGESKTTASRLCRVRHAGEAKIAGRLASSHESPADTDADMSSCGLGLIHTKSGVVASDPRSVASCVYGTTSAGHSAASA